MLRKKLLDCGFHLDKLRLAFGNSFKPRNDEAIARDEKRDGQPKHTAIPRPESGVAQNHRKIEAKPAGQRTSGGGIVIHGDGDDLKAVGGIFRLPCCKLGQFNLAGCAPGGPEVEQHDLTPIRVQADPDTVEAAPYELRRGLVQQGVRRLNGDGCPKQERASAKEDRPPKSPFQLRTLC